MRKTTLSLLTILAMSTAAFADGSMYAEDKYNLAYPTLQTDNQESDSYEEASLWDKWFGDYVEDEPSGMYVGLGFGSLRINDDFTNEEISSNSISFQIGYVYNQYMAFEGRFYWGIGDANYDAGNLGSGFNNYSGDVSAWGIYLKPSIPLGPVKLYGLAGYGSVTIDDVVDKSTGSAFQWGGGMSFAFDKEITFFIDYLSLYDDDNFDNRAIGHNISSHVITFGVNYKF